MSARLDTKVKARLLRVLAKERDAWKILNAFQDLEWDSRAAAVVELMRDGSLDLIKDVKLWDLLPLAADLLSADELLTFLGKVEKLPRGCSCPHLPFWPGVLDLTVMKVALRPDERAALVAGCAALANKKLRSGLAWCLVRFGEDTRALIGDQSLAVAKNYELRDAVLWPEPWAGRPAVGNREIWDARAQMPTPFYDEMLQILGDPARHAKAQLKHLLADVKKGGKKDIYNNWSLDYIRPALALASDAELVGIIKYTKSARASLERTLATLPRFTPTLVAWLVRELQAAGARNEVVLPMAQWGVARAFACGEAPAPALLAAIKLDGPATREAEFAISTWLNDVARGLQAAGDRTTFDNVVKLDLASVHPGLETALAGFAGLAPAQVDEIAARSLGEPQAVATYLQFVGDPAVIDAVIHHALGWDSWQRTVAYGLGFAAPTCLPKLAAAFDAATSDNVRAKFGFACTLMLARLGEAGQTWASEWDRLISPHNYGWLFDSYEGAHLVFRKAMQHLPRARARGVLLALLALPTRPIHVAELAWGVAPHADDPDLFAAFIARVVADEVNIKHSTHYRLSSGLRAFPDVDAAVRGILNAGGGLYMGDVLVAAVGAERHAQLVRECKGATAATTDPIDKVRAIAASLGTRAGETLVALRVLDGEPTGLARVGGVPPGLTIDEWPEYDGEPMVHLFTVDFAQIPGEQPRVMSLFCARPGLNFASVPDSEWTVVCWQTAEQAAVPGQAPADAEVRPARGLEVVLLPNIPANVWEQTEGPLGQLCTAIIQLPARMFGRPQWVQEPEWGGEFVMQFDGQFVDINLGDCGIMYVFADTAFWQCG